MTGQLAFVMRKSDARFIQKRIEGFLIYKNIDTSHTFLKPSLE
jgi:hypothetical protein